MLIRLANKKLLDTKKATFKDNGILIGDKNKGLLIPYSQIKWIENGKPNLDSIKAMLDA